MKFVTVMDMWLLVMNGILLGAILYYGRKLLNIVARAANKQDENSIEAERKRIINIIVIELNMYKQMASMGDKEAGNTAILLQELIGLINKDKK